MSATSKKIVFFGNGRLATGVTTKVPTLHRLLESGYEVCAVVSNFTEGQSRNARDLEIKEVAAQHNIPLLLPQKLTEIKDQLQAFGADAGILVAYGKIISQDIIDLFPAGIINIHPSLLPLHRGPTPIESVILNGEPNTGVSIMQLVKAMDAGPVYAQKPLTLTGHETKQELADQLLNQGAELLISSLPGILDGTLKPKPQDDSKATYDKLINKSDGQIDWTKPAGRLEREIRAYAGWPQSRVSLGSRDVVITKAHVVDVKGQPGELQINGKQLVIACGQQGLSLDWLKPAGKAEMTAEGFLAGYST